MASFLDRPEQLLDEALEELGLDSLTNGRKLGPPQTFTKLDHALTIRSGTGRTIGAIEKWSTQQGRKLQDSFEVEVNSNGLPVEVIPQTLDTRTIGVSRYDLYASNMEEAFGTTDLVVLTLQAQPFRVSEIWRDPAGRLRVIEYICWFENVGRNLSASGNRIVQADATLRWISKRQLL